jgi:hypothetical protein
MVTVRCTAGKTAVRQMHPFLEEAMNNDLLRVGALHSKVMYDEAVELLMECVSQGCTIEDGTLDTRKNGENGAVIEGSMFYIDFLESMLERFSDDDFERCDIETLAKRLLVGDGGTVTVAVRRSDDGKLGIKITADGVLPEEVLQIGEALQRRAIELLVKSGQMKPCDCDRCECEGIEPPLDERKDVV